MDDRCFICGCFVDSSEPPWSSSSLQEQMNRLISVNQTLAHSSTIISDILSRILNKSVMQEETICCLCFNLLNDIDYHLKEAQEKTDEITCKFLDKEKDPHKYKPQPIITAAEAGESSGSTTPLKTLNASTKKSSSSSKKRKSLDAPQQQPSEEPPEEPVNEMSVNSLNKNKQKLLISVLHPNKKSRLAASSRASEAASVRSDEEPLQTEREDEDDLVLPPRKHKKSKKKRKKASSSSSTRKENIENRSSAPCSSSSSSELVTLNMDELGDLFSKPKEILLAKKSDPPPPEEEDLKKECHLCDKAFKRKSNLQIHMERVHQVNSHVGFIEEEIPETHCCDLCPREFVNAKSLLQHRAEHSLPQNSSSASKATSSVPPPKVSNEESKAKCPKCDKTFKRATNMRIHIDRVHNKSRPFSCEICSKAFATNSDLKQHINVHGKGKNFKCEDCGREFTNRDSIILHRKQHNQQRTHFCNICHKGFYKASCLTRHTRTHTGEKPFKCELCGKAFTQSTSLKVHRVKCGKKRDSRDDEEEEDPDDQDE